MNLYTTRIEHVIDRVIKPNLKNIYDLRVRGKTEKQVATILGITTKEFADAMEHYDDLKEIWDSGMQILSSQLRNVVIERALDIDQKKDKDGNRVGPDTNLAMRMLEKIDPQFSKKADVGELATTVESIIKELGRRAKETIAREEAKKLGEKHETNEESI